MRIVFLDAAGGNRRAQKAVLAVQIRERARDLGRAADRRRRAEPLDHALPQQVLVQLELAAEQHLGDVVQRRQQVFQVDAAVGRRLRVHLHVLEPPEAEQVRDRLADVGHRERLASVRLNDPQQPLFGRRPIFDEQYHVGDRPADVRRGADGRLLRGRLWIPQQQEQDSPDQKPR